MFNPLTLSATEAQRLLNNGTITSASLVDTYLDQIERHNHNGLHLNALISVAPRDKLVKAARKLDSERRDGKLQGPLHGIPIIIKDLFVTKGLGLPTTAGTPSLLTASTKRTAPLIQHLISSGLIILATSNLTEFCGLKYKGITPGWCPMGGQTHSPYIFGGLEKDEKMLGNSSIGGSSSGSAAAVAAGFAPLSIGTECCGSLMTPANRAGLYALKCGLDAVDTGGVFHYTDSIDFIGGMAKIVEDLNLLTTALMQKTKAFDVEGGFRGLRVGFCDVRVWRLPEEICSWPGGTWEQVVSITEMEAVVLVVLKPPKESEYANAMTRMRSHGAEVYEELDLPSAWEAFNIEGKSPFYEIAFYELANKTLASFLGEFEDSPVQSIKDIIEYNDNHPDKCLPPDHPSQSELHDLAAITTTPEEHHAMLAELRKRGQSGLGRLFREMDVVVALTESPLCMYTTAIGCPIACMPLGTVKYSDANERPFGICAAAPSGAEGLLLRKTNQRGTCWVSWLTETGFMRAFEAIFPARPLPRPLVRESDPLAG